MNLSLKRILILLSSVLLLYLLGIFFIYIFLNQVIFSPTILSQNKRYLCSADCEQVILKHPNKEEIICQYFRTNKLKKGIILFLHDVQGNLNDWLEYSTAFTAAGFDVFMPEYRGFGRSRGSCSEIALYEDATLAAAFLKSKIREDSLHIYGIGLAGTVAAYLGTITPARTVVIQNPVYDLRNLIRQRFPALLLPFELRYDFSTYEYIGNVISPVHILATAGGLQCTPQELMGLKSLLSDPKRFSFIDLKNTEELTNHPDFVKFLEQNL